MTRHNFTSEERARGASEGGKARAARFELLPGSADRDVDIEVTRVGVVDRPCADPVEHVTHRPVRDGVVLHVQDRLEPRQRLLAHPGQALDRAFLRLLADRSELRGASAPMLRLSKVAWSLTSAGRDMCSLVLACARLSSLSASPGDALSRPLELLDERRFAVRWVAVEIRRVALISSSAKGVGQSNAR